MINITIINIFIAYIIRNKSFSNSFEFYSPYFIMLVQLIELHTTCLEVIQKTNNIR